MARQRESKGGPIVSLERTRPKRYPAAKHVGPTKNLGTARKDNCGNPPWRRRVVWLAICLSPMIASDRQREHKQGNAINPLQGSIREMPHDHGRCTRLPEEKEATLPLSSRLRPKFAPMTLAGKRKNQSFLRSQFPSQMTPCLSCPCLGRLSPGVACTRGARSSSQLAGPPRAVVLFFRPSTSFRFGLRCCVGFAGGELV